MVVLEGSLNSNSNTEKRISLMRLQNWGGGKRKPWRRTVFDRSLSLAFHRPFCVSRGLRITHPWINGQTVIRCRTLALGDCTGPDELPLAHGFIIVVEKWISPDDFVKWD